jgi:hypothetical protein
VRYTEGTVFAMSRLVSANGPVSPELVRAQLTRILASAAFETNPRAAAFLAFVVGEALGGRADGIKQATIGCEVFGRPATYDPKRDAIVRSVARVVREKLNGYYLAEGKGDFVRIEIPKGSYLPVFAPLDPAEPAPVATPAELPRPRQNIAFRRAAATMAVFLLTLTGFGVGGRGKPAASAMAGDPADLYRVGGERLLAGDWVGARPLLESAALRAPADAMIHATLARDLMALGYSALALDEARKAEAAGGRLTHGGELEVEAIFRSASGEHLAAAAAFGELARQYPDRPWYLLSLAQEQLASGRPADCLRTVARARPPADALFALTEAYCRAGAGDYLGALDPVRRAEGAARQRSQREIYAHARLLEAGLLMSTNRLTDSIPARDEARRICVEIGDDSCAIGALRIEANAEISRMRPGVALAAYRAALPLARKMGSVRQIAELLDGEGYARMLMDDFAGSNAAFVDALLTAQRAGQRTAGLRQDMVELALAQGQLDRAAILAEQAGQDAATDGDRVTEAAAHIFEARALFLRGDLTGCAAILERVRQAIGKFHLSADIPRRWRIAHANLNRALGRLDLAARDLQARNDFGDTSRDLDYRVAQLQLLLSQARYGDAVGAARETLALLNGGGNQSACILVTALLSDAYGYAGRLGEARETANSARAMLSDHTTPMSRSTALASAARWAQPALEASARPSGRR